MNIPDLQILIPFALLLVPGIIVLILASLISGSDLKKRSDIELVVLAVVLSLVSLFLSGVPMSIEGMAEVAQSTAVLLTVLGNSVILGLLLGALSIVWLHVGGFVSGLSQRIGAHIGVSFMSYDKGCIYYVLNNVLMEGTKNKLIVESIYGDIFKGFLGGFSENPAEVILISDNGVPVMKFTQDKWNPLEEFIVHLTEKKIKRISVVKD